MTNFHVANRPLAAGDYRLEFSLGKGTFFERLSLDLHISDPARSYHVPLLCTPWAYSTYRGS